MIPLVSKQNVQAPTATYPKGQIKDDDGTGNGTPVNVDVYGDFHQFFEQLIADSGISPNHLPDSEYDGYQLFQAFQSYVGGRMLTASSDFNQIIKIGLYATNGTPSNSPITLGSNRSFLFVGKYSASSILQYLVTSEGFIFYRTYTPSTWSSWVITNYYLEFNSGTWNMDSTVSITIAHGLSAGFLNSIRRVSAIILPDVGTGLPERNIDCYSSQAVQGGVFVDATNITVERLTGGIFDSANYDDTVFISSRSKARIEFGLLTF